MIRLTSGRRPRSLSAVKRSLATLALAVALAAPVAVSSSAAGTDPADPTNPLAGHPFGHETATDAGNAPYNSWRAASGDAKTNYGRVGLTSRARWYGAWSGTGSTLTTKIRRYVANLQAGDPNTVAPITFFRIWPNGEGDRRPLTAAQQTAYKQWYAAAATGIGSSRVAVVLEPDLPLVLPRHGATDTAVRLGLVRYAAQKLAALPNTTVYIDAGSSDWMPEDKDRAVVTDMLRRAGVQSTRGFELGATHYDSAASNISYAQSVSAALATQGVEGAHAVIDTADNGRPFTHAQYASLQKRGYRTNHYDNADVCIGLNSTLCVTLGIPPTTDVANTRWGFSDPVNQAALDTVDAFLWIGRPWLKMQADPYCAVRAIQVGRTAPFFSPPTFQYGTSAVKASQSKCFAKP